MINKENSKNISENSSGDSLIYFGAQDVIIAAAEDLRRVEEAISYLDLDVLAEEQLYQVAKEEAVKAMYGLLKRMCE